MPNIDAWFDEGVVINMGDVFDIEHSLPAKPRKKTPAKKAAKAQITVRPEPDVVLALDLSLGHTGYAMIRLATGEIEKGVIEPPNLKAQARLVYLRDQVLKLAKSDLSLLVLIEGYAYGAKGAAVISLGELGGVIRTALWEEEIPFLEIAPAQLKRFTTGKGNAPKQVMLMEILDRWGVKHHDDNVADAFALMQLGLALVGRPTKPLLAFQQAVIANLQKTLTFGTE